MRRLSRFSAAVALLALAALVAPRVAADGETAADFGCHLCTELIAQVDARTEHPIRSWDGLRGYLRSSGYCRGAAVGQFNPCEVVVPAVERLAPRADAGALASSARAACVQLELCPADVIFNAPRANQAALDALLKSPFAGHAHKARTPKHHPAKAIAGAAADATTTTTPVHDLRVSLAHGSRGYNNVRLSYVDNVARNHSAEFMAFFDYNEPFKYVWTEKWLHTTVKPFANATQTTFAIGEDFNVTVPLPAEGKGVRGLIFGDPCFSGEWVGCRHGKELDIFNRLTSVLNAALVKDVDMWVLLGDTFYDPHGILGPQFNAALTLESKSHPVVTIPGNHDFWQHGSPVSKKGGYDTYGNGFMQYWLADSSAAIKNERNGSKVPFDFSVDPSTKVPANVNNFFTYNLIGNAAFIVFSGANTKEESDALLHEACEWVGRVNPAVTFVSGHWSSSHGGGCQPGMSTKEVHERVITTDGCKERVDRIKWLEGHQHCNWVVKPGVGFRIAGFGMSGCHGKEDPNFGVPFFETTDEGHFTIGYFPVVGGNGTVPRADEGKSIPQDQPWDTVFNCIQQNGISGCKHLAVIWHHQD